MTEATNNTVKTERRQRLPLKTRLARYAKSELRRFTRSLKVQLYELVFGVVYLCAAIACYVIPFIAANWMYGWADLGNEKANMAEFALVAAAIVALSLGACLAIYMPKRPVFNPLARLVDTVLFYTYGLSMVFLIILISIIGLILTLAPSEEAPHGAFLYAVVISLFGLLPEKVGRRLHNN